MTTQPPPRTFTADEFIAWSMSQPGRFELAGGVVVEMAANALGCEAMMDGVAVRIDERTVYEPDTLVRCGERTPGEAVTIDDPTIVVEVVSPSLAALDTGTKLVGYFRLPSVRHYLVVNTGVRAVTHHRLDEAGSIATRILRGGQLALDPPGITVDVGDFFATL